MTKRVRDYKKEYADYHGKPEQIKRRAARNQSRQKLKDAGVDVAGKDVDHKVGACYRYCTIFCWCMSVIYPVTLITLVVLIGPQS